MMDAESWALSYLLNSLWQVPLLLAMGWLAARLVRRLGPGVEHRVWVGVLLLQAALPAVSSLPLAWLQSLRHWSAGGTAPGAAHVSVEIGPGAGFTGWHVGASLLRFAAIAYCVALAYFAARFLWRCLRLSAIQRDASELALTADMARVWAQRAQHTGVKRVTLATGARITTPVTIGIWRKTILLPEQMAHSLGDAEFRTIIDHELAHIARNDFAKNLVYELLSLPVSYHPLLHATRARIMETREMVCDERAAEVGGAMEYGRCLLRLATRMVCLPAGTPHTIGIFDGKTLERRLMRLKNREVEIKGGRRIAALFACAVLAGATCVSALALHMNVDAAAAPDAKSNPKFVHVSPSVMQGNVLSKVMPKYPPEAKKKRIQGKVTLDATISEQGDVEDLKVASGPEALRQSALDAVKQWKYRPFLLNGQPIAVKTTINVIYSLQK
jgi:TonB family protein